MATAMDEQIENALKKIKRLQAEIEEYEEAVANLKQFIADNVEEGERTFGKLKATVYVYKKYDEAFGKRNAPELWAEHAVEHRVLDSATAKRVLSPDEYALFQKPSGSKSVKVDVLD